MMLMADYNGQKKGSFNRLPIFLRPILDHFPSILETVYHTSGGGGGDQT
jgi:hypothetical protein